MDLWLILLLFLQVLGLCFGGGNFYYLKIDVVEDKLDVSRTLSTPKEVECAALCSLMENDCDGYR